MVSLPLALPLRMNESHEDADEATVVCHSADGLWGNSDRAGIDTLDIGDLEGGTSIKPSLFPSVIRQNRSKEAHNQGRFWVLATDEHHRKGGMITQYTTIIP